MTNTSETFEEQRVTYTLQKEDKFYVVENVPARVSSLTGETLFAPQTVAQLQKIKWVNGIAHSLLGNTRF